VKISSDLVVTKGFWETTACTERRAAPLLWALQGASGRSAAPRRALLWAEASLSAHGASERAGAIGGERCDGRRTREMGACLGGWGGSTGLGRHWEE